MIASCDNGVIVRLLANDTSEGYFLEHLFIRVVWFGFLFLLAFGVDVPLFIKLPPLFVILSSVEKFAAVC